MRTRNGQTVTVYKDWRKDDTQTSNYERWWSDSNTDKGVTTSTSGSETWSSSYTRREFKGGYSWSETISGTNVESVTKAGTTTSKQTNWSWSRTGTVWDDGRNNWNESWSKSNWENGKSVPGESETARGSYDPKGTGTQTNNLPKAGEAPRLTKPPKDILELNKQPKHQPQPSKEFYEQPIAFEPKVPDNWSAVDPPNNAPKDDKIQRFIRELRKVMAQGKQAVIDFLKGFLYHCLKNGVGLLKDVADLLYPPGAKSDAEIEAYYRNNLSFQAGRAVANGLTFLAGILGILLIGLTIGGSGGSTLIVAPAQAAALVASGNMTAASVKDIISIVSQVFQVNSGNTAGTFHSEPRRLSDEEALSQGLRVHNRPQFSEKDMQGALPNPAGQAGHAGKHDISKQLQADIINNPERVFIGINDNGRQVTIFYKDGNVVITQDNDFTRVITAYGSSGISRASGGQVRPGTPVSPNRWINNPNYVEIMK